MEKYSWFHSRCCSNHPAHLTHTHTSKDTPTHAHKHKHIVWLNLLINRCTASTVWKALLNLGVRSYSQSTKSSNKEFLTHHSYENPKTCIVLCPVAVNIESGMMLESHTLSCHSQTEKHLFVTFLGIWWLKVTTTRSSRFMILLSLMLADTTYEFNVQLLCALFMSRSCLKQNGRHINNQIKDS